MVNLKELESRVSVLERELAELKRSSTASDDPNAWIDRVSGRFKDDQEFTEIVRLGREYRRSCSEETEA